MKVNWDEITRIVIRVHEEGGCKFAPGAYGRIIKQLDGLEKYDIKKVEEIFRQEEIYCPREGIDKRAEFGMEM